MKEKTSPMTLFTPLNLKCLCFFRVSFIVFIIKYIVNKTNITAMHIMITAIISVLLF